MGIKSIYQKLDNKAHIISRQMGAKASAKHYFQLRKKQNLPIVHLTKEQKTQVREAWNGQVNHEFATHELVLSATGIFDPYICPEYLFRTNIELALNNFNLKFGFSDKNYFDKMFPNIPMPKTVVHNINGVFLDADYKPFPIEKFLQILNEYDAVIVKPSIDNGFGKSVKLYHRDEYDSILRDFNRDYIVQEVFKQHKSLSALNASSVNVVRVISLSLNGIVSPVNCALRCGAEGAITDNSVTKDGKGMFVVGVEKDGTLKSEAYHSSGIKINVAPNGQNFAGIQLPNFHDALQMTTSIHQALPHFGFIAFDVCFDESGNPNIMEYNIKGPGVLYYQYANGPLFGERTQEVIDTFLKK